MEEMKYMEELNTVSNMRSIALKLPFKLRVKWCNKAYELQEQHKQRIKILELQIAEQRLQSLKKKMKKDEQYKQECVAFLNDMFENNYAEEVPQEELTQSPAKVWYLAHHGVYHPKMKKIRVVFDCAASYQGVSLNTELLQGPDLTNSLIGVILRFRKEPIRIMGDIKSMFHQVRVAESDVNYLRFLWW